MLETCCDGELDRKVSARKYARLDRVDDKCTKMRNAVNDKIEEHRTELTSNGFTSTSSLFLTSTVTAMFLARENIF
jgi:phage host-nuclease inhibitor protein Gam